MNDILLKEKKEDLKELRRMYRTIENELCEIKRRREIHILGCEYNNGIYLQSIDVGYPEALNFVEMLLNRYKQEIDKEMDNISIIESVIENE